MVDNNQEQLDQENLTQEQIEQQEKRELFMNKPEAELFSALSDSFYNYYNTNKESLKNLSIEDIFLQFLRQRGTSDQQFIIEELERKLGREINFNDIKNLYLKSGYTLETTISKDIFKNFKRKNALKSVIRKFEQKINSKLSELEFLNINFEQFLDKDIINNEDVDKLYEKINEEFHSILKKIKQASENEQISEQKREQFKKLFDSLRKLVVTNEEIVNQMEKDNIISEKEKKFLTEQDVSDLNTRQIQETNNIFNTLFNVSVLHSIKDYLDTMKQIKLDFEKFKTLGTISDAVVPYLESMTLQEIDNIFENKIKLNLSNEQLEEFNKCGKLNGENAAKICEENLKKNLVLEYLEKNLSNLADYIDTKDTQLASIIRKIKTKSPLTEDEKWYLFSILKNEYIENILNFVVPAFGLNDTEKHTYKEILEALFEKNDKIKLNGPSGLQEFSNIEKIISLPDEIDDFFGEIPRFMLKIKDDNVDLFKAIFPKYFVNIKINGQEKQISKFSKVNITTNNGIKTGYIKENENGEIELYNNYNDENPIETIKKENIQNIVEIEKILELSNEDLPKLLMGIVASFPGKNLEQGQINLIDENMDMENSLNDNLESEEERQERIRKFNREWQKLEGDNSLTKPKVGDIIQVKGKSLNIPGLLNNWFYAEIVNINKERGTFKLKIGGGLLDFEGGVMEKEVPMEADIIKNIKYNFNGNAFRFEKKDNLNDFVEYIKDLDLASDVQGFKGTLSKWKNADIKVVDGKLAKKGSDGKYETIDYIGRQKVNNINNNEIIEGAKSRTDLYDVWKIEYKGDKVILKAPDTNFSKEMDLNTFMTVFLQNDLSPWTGKEYRTVKQDFETVVKGPKPSLFYSINDIVLATKHIKDSFMYHFKEDDDLRAAMMYEKLTKMLPGIWFLKDVKLEAGGEKESKIWKVIEDAKSRLERAGEGKGENHGKKAAAVIESEIFSLVKKGKKLSTRHRLKAAGYLLYAMEKGPGPYFRKLAPYAGQGMWIKALLGDEHYYKWKAKVQDLQEKLRENPDNQQTRNALVLSEMFYIKDDPSTGDMYSARFGPTLEGLAIEVTGDLGKAEKAYEGEGKKGSFELIQEGLKSYITNDRPSNAIGALKALSERIETQKHYVDYHKIITSFIFSGYLYNSWGTPYREEFDKICRTYSIPIGFFARETNGVNKVLYIFDYLVKKKGIRPGGKNQSFTEYLYGKSDPDKVNIFELNGQSARKDVLKKMELFWGEYGEEMVSSLDYTDTILLDYSVDNDIDDKEKEYIGEYFEKVNAGSLGEKWEISKTFKTSYAPYYQDGVLNMSAAAFGEYAINIDEGNFEDEIGAGIWEGLIMKLDRMSDFMHKDDIYEFMLKRFSSWFGRYYSGENGIMFIKALRSGDKNELNEAIYKHLKYSIGGHHGLIPPEMEEGLQKLVEIFSIRPENIENIINNEFEERLVEQSYYYTINDLDIQRNSSKDKDE